MTMDLSIREDFTLSEHDEDRFNWYIESWADVPPNSRLQEIIIILDVLIPFDSTDLGSQGVWGVLVSVLSGDNLQLSTFAIDLNLDPLFFPSDAKELKELEMWLMETCLPKVTARCSRNNKETGEEKRTNSLTLLILAEE